jgi:FMN phosphatase YigB (HAD superfamily)
MSILPYPRTDERSELAQQAAIFDHGGVLSGSSAEWRDSVEREFGIPASTWGPLLAGPNGVETVLRGRPFTTADMIPVMAERLVPFAGGRELAASRRICSLFTDPSSQERIPEVVALLGRLHSAGIRVGILSNSPSDSEATVMAALIQSGNVDAVGLSGTDGVGKPAPRAFTLMLDRLGVPPAQAWFIDDDARHVAAARALGINAAVFDGDVGGLEDELRTSGLDW